MLMHIIVCTKYSWIVLTTVPSSEIIVGQERMTRCKENKNIYMVGVGGTVGPNRLLQWHASSFQNSVQTKTLTLVHPNSFLWIDAHSTQFYFYVHLQKTKTIDLEIDEITSISPF